MKRLMILGAGVMQGPAIRIAKKMGLEVVAVDGNPAAPNAAAADRFYHIDLKDKEAIAALGASLQRNGGLDGIMTAGTDFSASVAWAAGRLGLPGIPYEAALDASDKERMRRRFRQAGVPSPEFVVYGEEGGGLPPRSECRPERCQAHKVPGTGAPFYASPLSGGDPRNAPLPSLQADASSPLPTPHSPLPTFPVVVKPVDNMGARGCRRADNEQELAAALQDALAFSRSHRAIMETFMEGPEFSVDALVYRGRITICGLADRHIFFPPYFIEMGHTMPAALDPAEAGSLLAVFEAGVRALGIDNGAAKGDIKLTPSGPMIGEIAARLSGGYMSGWTYPYASGVEVTAGAIRIALGLDPGGLRPRRDWTCAERAFISIPGRVAAVEGIAEAQQTPAVRDIFFRVAEGSDITFPQNNVGKAGNILACAPARAAAVTAAETACRRILLPLEYPNRETEEFLWGVVKGNGESGIGNRESKKSFTPRFPPDAFALTPELEEMLRRMPFGEAENWESECSGIGNRESGIEKESRHQTSIFSTPDSRLPTPDLSTPDSPLPTPEPDPPLPTPHSPLPTITLTPFPELLSSPLRDYLGRTTAEALEAVRQLSGEALPEAQPGAASGSLGREFWAALVRGSYQGALYVLQGVLQGAGGAARPVTEEAPR
jgi:biotin carboxylase